MVLIVVFPTYSGGVCQAIWMIHVNIGAYGIIHCIWKFYSSILSAPLSLFYIPFILLGFLSSEIEEEREAKESETKKKGLLLNCTFFLFVVYI